MKTIKVLYKNLDSDLYDFYFDNYIENYDIILYSNSRDLKNYNDEIITNIIESLNNYDDFKEYFNNFESFISYYHLEKENGKKWSNKEKNIYKMVFESFNNSNNYYYYSNKDIIKILNIIKCKKYNCVSISGFCQGDKTNLFYNENEIDNYTINLIESLYFGGCQEIIFTSDKIRKIENIFNCSYESFLIPFSYNIDEIKKEIQKYYKNEKIKIDLFEAIEKQTIKIEYNKIN